MQVCNAASGLAEGVGEWPEAQVHERRMVCFPYLPPQVATISGQDLVKKLLVLAEDKRLTCPQAPLIYCQGSGRSFE